MKGEVSASEQLKRFIKFIYYDNPAEAHPCDVDSILDWMLHKDESVLTPEARKRVQS